MASQQPHRSVLLQRWNHFRSTTATTTLPYYIRNFNSLQLSRKFLISEKIRVFNLTYGGGRHRFCCLCKTNYGPENVPVQIKQNNDGGRPPFDINLAVVLAGFAFEAYTTPPEKIGTREVDAANCTTVFLSESFLREIYDGQLFIKLKKGLKLPAMDPWGTSDPYVVFQLDSQVLKSKVKWGTREPTWNEDFTLNIKLFPSKNLQIAAWDANLVTPHKRMGNGSLSLESLCDGNPHEVLVELEGMGGGGEIQLEIRFKTFDAIDEDNKWWAIPMVTDFLRRSGFESAMKMIVGTETVQAREFVQYAFGQMKLLNDAYGQTDWLSKLGMSSGGYIDTSSSTAVESDLPAKEEHDLELCGNETIEDEKFSLEVSKGSSGTGNGQASLYAGQHGDEVQSDKYFWKNFGSLINENVVQKLGLPPPEKIKWDGFDLLNRIGFQSRRIAEASYIESGLATPVSEDNINNDGSTGSTSLNDMKSSLPDIEKVTRDLLRQTDSILGALMVLNATVSKLNKEGLPFGKSKSKEESTGNEDRVSQYARDKNLRGPLDRSELDENKAEEMRALFSTAETAMEAWAMLATSLGQPSFIKSEFEKICFLDNQSTDTQVAIWRDSPRKRLVVAFRGTEQTKWKDLVTDLMVLPAGLNPERIGGDFNQEVQVHSGFLSAYDSVRNRILSLINVAMGYRDSGDAPSQPWHVYVTGHSLGGALATLLALDISSSRLSKCGSIFVTMYNFGSPRVGNKLFAEVYNEKVKDSWRIVNHRDIIPTVPRLMGYCHVAQPIYLATGGQKMATENMELSGDGYQGDVIGEATPDVLVSEFMKGEKELIEKILNTEINIFRSIRDGSALMQHMEDFYYITLLENVRLNYQDVGTSQTNEKNRL